MRRHPTTSPIAFAKLSLAMLGPSLLAVIGCSSGLETGYTPRALGVSSAERRAYYASPYTAEAAAGEQSKSSPGADANAARRPNMGPRQY